MRAFAASPSSWSEPHPSARSGLAAPGFVAEAAAFHTGRSVTRADGDVESGPAGSSRELGFLILGALDIDAGDRHETLRSGDVPGVTLQRLRGNHWVVLPDGGRRAHARGVRTDRPARDAERGWRRASRRQLDGVRSI